MKIIILLLIPFVCLASKTTETPDFSGFPNHVCEFLTTNYPKAKAIEIETGIPTAITLGVSALESGYGMSKRALNWNAYFGISKRKYITINDSFIDFSNLLHNQRYCTILEIDKTDLKEWCLQLHLLGYNPFSHYPNKLNKVINYINRNKQLVG